MKNRIIIAACALALISCDKREPELDSKLSQLEKQATEAIERQRQLEAELAEQKILAERDAIERERTIIEQERIAMEQLRDAEHANALAELERRQAELMERERRISENQAELDGRQQLLTGLERELSERELDLAGREPLEALPPVQKNYVSGPSGDFTNFYEPLASYGSWFQTSDYGYVYQPSIVRDTTWRPYTRGRWAFTDHGWTWVSNEPFGWACYHYGRWALLRNIGWVWIPGNQWAPAWVSWRESPGYIGWAPLPPETLAWHSNSWDSSIDIRFGIDSTWFSFVSYQNFGSDIYSHCLPYTQNLVIYQSTITVTHYVFRDRIVYCGGPRYRNVCDRIGRRFPIHRLRHDYSPDFGRGGRRLHSQFSGNELLVVSPRMDAEWNPALRPSRVSRDLGQVVVNRTNELPEDVRKQYRDRRQQDEEVATRWVANTGGREAFENDRKIRIEKNREVVVKNESPRRADRESGSENNNKPDRPQPPVVTDTSDGSDNLKKRPNVWDSKRPDPGNPTTPNPEFPSKGEPTITDLNKARNENLNNNSGNLPPGVTPTPPVAENRLTEPSTGALRNQGNENRETDRTDAEKQAAKDLRQQQEAAREERLRLDRDLKLQQEQQADLLRQQQMEAKKAQQKQEELELGQRQQQEKLQKLNQQQEQDKRSREQKEQEERLRELKDKQELDRNEQQERLRAQQDQNKQAREEQERLRQQNAQQEQSGKQQEETQRRLKEQQEQLRAQKEQQERLRDQQEQQDALRQQQDEVQRRAKEQQEKQRAQQDQLERVREQQDEVQRRAKEQQEKQRAQQEQLDALRQQQDEVQRRAKEQQEKQRAQQEQLERVRQQQEEVQRRAQEQQEKQRAQQEQVERARQQQEEAQRRAQEQQERMRAQQEQQERARQQQEEAQRRAQEEAQRRMEEQQLRAQQEQQERMRQQQEQQERARQQQEEAQRRIQERQKQ